MVITPDGTSARYDGGYAYPSPVKTVIEAKTGYRWYAQPRETWSAKQIAIEDRVAKQRGRQLVVAKKCKLDYFIYFDNQTAATGLANLHPGWAPYIRHVPMQ